MQIQRQQHIACHVQQESIQQKSGQPYHQPVLSVHLESIFRHLELRVALFVKLVSILESQGRQTVHRAKLTHMAQPMPNMRVHVVVNIPVKSCLIWIKAVS
jgi:hypothetical protein